MKIIKENITQKNKNKIANILKNKSNEDFKIIKELTEPNDLKLITNNMLLQYEIETDNTIELKNYLEETLIINLKQFLKNKGYELTSSPKFKVTEENNKIIMKFLNIFETDGINAIFSQKMLANFEEHLKDKISFIFNTNIKTEEKKNIHEGLDEEQIKRNNNKQKYKNFQFKIEEKNEKIEELDEEQIKRNNNKQKYKNFQFKM
jgi:hypothetical protein